MPETDRRSNREEKLENLMVNRSLILMGMFEETFSAIAERLGAGRAEGGPSPPDAKMADDRIPSAIRSEIESLFSSLREEVSSGWPKNERLFREYVSSPRFDEGIAIVERCDFGRPRLTERLSDEVLASYVFLLQSGDKSLTAMFKELAEWESGLPRPPWAPAVV